MSTTALILMHPWNSASDVEPDSVRSTVTGVRPDAESATMSAPPQFNSHETDPDTDGGLTRRDLSSYVVPREKAPPVPSPAVDLERVNDQVASSGTAAAREASGQWGHGNVYAQWGIEPVIREGGQFSDQYFAADAAVVQEGTGDYMLPARRPDTVASGAVQSAGERGMADARMGSIYDQWLNAVSR